MINTLLVPQRQDTHMLSIKMIAAKTVIQTARLTPVFQNSTVNPQTTSSRGSVTAAGRQEQSGIRPLRTASADLCKSLTPLEPEKVVRHSVNLCGIHRRKVNGVAHQ